MPGTEQIEEQHHSDNLLRLDQLEAAQAAQAEAMAKLSSDVHALKGNMAGNTSLTQAALDGIDAIKAQISQLAQLDVPSLKEIADAMNSMKGGIRVLGWLERPAKWFAVMAGAAAAGLALWVKWKTK